MKFVIRGGMFETNSSSSHSIIINRDNKIEVPKSNDCYTCDPNGRNYGRQSPKILMNPIAKINFLMCFKAWLLKENWEEVNKEFRSNLIEICKSKGFHIDIKNLKKHPKWNEPNFHEEGFYDLTEFSKYIDDKEFLKEFIFDIKSFIFITGDEYEEFFEVSSMIDFLDYPHETIPQVDNNEFCWYALSDSIYEEERENEDYN